MSWDLKDDETLAELQRMTQDALGAIRRITGLLQRRAEYHRELSGKRPTERNVKNYLLAAQEFYYFARVVKLAEEMIVENTRLKDLNEELLQQFNDLSETLLGNDNPLPKRNKNDAGNN